MRFRPEQHLRRPSEIRAVREQGRRIECRAFTIWWKRRDAFAPGQSSDAQPDNVNGAPTANVVAPATPAACADALVPPYAMPPPANADTGPAPAQNSARAKIRREPRPAPGPQPRACVIASTSAVGHAVLRNRAKRRLRELFRHQQQLVPAGCDLLLIARRDATHRPMTELEKKFADACGLIHPATARDPQRA